MRLVQMIHARNSTAAYRAAALVRLVTEVTPLPTSVKRRTADGGWLTLAKGAVILVHDELAVKITLDLGADSFVVRGVRGGDIRRRITRWRLTGAHRAALLVLDEVAVQSAVRQFRANFVIFRQHVRHEVDLQIIGALADRAVIFVHPQAVEAFHLAVIQGRLAELVRVVIKGTVDRRWAMRAAFTRIGWYRILTRLAHGCLAGRESILVADASDTVVLLPLLTEFPRDALVNTVLRFLFSLRPRDRI